MRNILFAVILVLTSLFIPMQSNIVETEASTEMSMVSFQEKVALSSELDKAGYLSLDSTTKGNPFPANAGGSELFRIPAMITLADGTLFAAADARYETLGDGGGLDTIIAMSKDNGATWEQSYAIRYPDSKGFADTKATTCIDPVVVQGPDGTIYVMADMNPTGVTTKQDYINPNVGTGYMNIGGKERLALTDDYSMVNTNPKYKPYPYYLGDMVNGYAPVMKTSDNSATSWALDGWWNIYRVKADGTYEALTQKQVDSDKYVQQCAYYKDSALHVYNTGYMLMVSSKDMGKTWTPRVLNTEIKRDTESALLVTPGKGIVTSDNTIIIPFYTFERAGAKIIQQASFIYSKDNGKSWHRSIDAPNGGKVKWSSESEIVEVNGGVLRMFIRNGTNRIAYLDAKWDTSKNDYTWSEPVVTPVIVWSNCNLTAVTLREKIDGKTALMVACPAGKKRTDGMIYTFLLEEDNTMTPVYEYAVNKGDYAYSCMDELKNGGIGLLYEAKPGTMEYVNISIEELTKNAYVQRTDYTVLIVTLSVVGGVLVVAGITTAVILVIKKKKQNKAQ